MSDAATDIDALAAAVRHGDTRAVARAISAVEDGTSAAVPLVQQLFRDAGDAFVVGVTGPPGAGKSTLVDQLTRELRRRGQTVGIVAVDPTSPFSGGAILGDRIRMQEHFLDEGVFIRSMATRGHLGGLAATTRHVLTILAASRKDVVILETVGVGQAEVDIAGTADVSLVVLVPGLGDEVQALKAGIMEIADVFVVNKADRDGVDRVVAEIEAMLTLAPEGAARPPIARTVATSAQGVADLWETVDRLRRDAVDSGAFAERRTAYMRRLLDDTIEDRMFQRVAAHVDEGHRDQIVASLVARERDPFAAADALLERAGLGRRDT